MYNFLFGFFTSSNGDCQMRLKPQKIAIEGGYDILPQIMKKIFKAEYYGIVLIPVDDITKYPDCEIIKLKEE